LCAVNWIQRKAAQNHLIRDAPPPVSSSIYHSKVPVLETPPGSLRGPLWRELPFPEPSLTYPWISSIKVLPIKRNLTLLSKALEKEHPPCSPKRGPYGNRCPIPEPSFTYSSEFPLKEPPPSSLHRAPTERCSVSRALLHPSLKAPGK